MEKIIKALEKNNFEVHYFETRAEVLAFVESLLPEGASISNGGSQSVTECGVFDLIKSGKYNYIDRFAATTPEEERKMIADYFTADYFFCSANAITENGELVNVDGRSNRVAAFEGKTVHLRSSPNCVWPSPRSANPNTYLDRYE